MFYEVTRANGIPLIIQMDTKESEKDGKKYTIKLYISLEQNNKIIEHKDFVIQVDDWNKSFYYFLVLLNEEEIERFKNSKKSEDKIPWFTLMLPSGLPAGSPRPGTLYIFRLPPCAGGENLKNED